MFPEPHATLGRESIFTLVRTLTLFVPSLFRPDAGHADLYADLNLRGLETLLGRGERTDYACEDEDAWLCQRFSVKRQPDWPIAPVTLRADDGDPGEDFWLRADPVSLLLHNDGLILVPTEALAIRADEAAQLVAALNHGFSAEGFSFVAPHPQRWYLRLASAPRIRTVSRLRATGRDINRLLPEGEDRLQWHRIFNEAQMLLHSHPVNSAREDADAAPINSLWFWGGGTLPAARTAFQQVHSGEALTRGLAQLADVSAGPVANFAESAGSGNTLIELRDAAHALTLGDDFEWRAALQALENDWFAPLLQSLQSGAVEHAVIATVVSGRSIEWSITRSRLWRIWRRARPITHHARNLQAQATQ